MKLFQKVAVSFVSAGLLAVAAPARAEKLTLEELPAAAKKTVEHETKGAMIEEIDQESDKAGKPVYEVEYKKDGVEKEIKVSPSGALLSHKKD